MWDRKQLKANAKELIKPNYWKVVVASLVLMFAMGSSGSAGSTAARNSDVQDELSTAAASMDTATLIAAFALIISVIAVAMVISIVVKIFVWNPLVVGAQKMFLNCKTDSAEYGDLVFGFKNSYGNIAKTMFLKDLFISLWSLLLVIPGIIKGYEYRMVPYILAENPQMSSKDAFAKSKQMMTGNKWNAFVLDLSFLGWVIIMFITCGIAGIFFVNPYVFLTDAELYHELKKKIS